MFEFLQFPRAEVSLLFHLPHDLAWGNISEENWREAVKVNASCFTMRPTRSLHDSLKLQQLQQFAKFEVTKL